MPEALTLEGRALAALCNAAAVDLEKARRLLDESGVQAHDFEAQPLAAVWAVVESMVRDGRTPDLFAVQPKCVGVPRELLSAVFLSDERGNAKNGLQRVREAGARRRAARALDVARRAVSDASRPIAETVAEALRTLEQFQLPDGRASTLDAEVIAFCDVLDEIAQGRRQPVMETGIDALDAVIGGLQRTLTIIGALPGVGKSALLAAIVRNLARRSVPVGVFSLEDERGWLVRRLLSEATGIPLFVLSHRPLTKRQQGDVAVQMERLHRELAHVVVDDRPALTSADIVASARDMLTRHGVKALLVDHLGEIRLTRSDRHDLDIADALQQLRALAKTYGVPVVVACHLRRREGLTPSSEPRLTDFAFSAAVERMARVALALSKPDDATLRVHVLKQTNGIAPAEVDLTFAGAAGVVANMASPDVRAKVDRLYQAAGERDE